MARAAIRCVYRYETVRYHGGSYSKKYYDARRGFLYVHVIVSKKFEMRQGGKTDVKRSKTIRERDFFKPAAYAYSEKRDRFGFFETTKIREITIRKLAYPR